MKPIADITSADEARDIAIEYSNTPRYFMGYGDLIEDQSYFEAIVEKFPELRDEFEENAII